MFRMPTKVPTPKNRFKARAERSDIGSKRNAGRSGRMITSRNFQNSNQRNTPHKVATPIKE